MTRSNTNPAYLFAVIALSAISLISCGGDASKEEKATTDTVVAPLPTVDTMHQKKADTTKIDTTKSEQNPPAIRR